MSHRATIPTLESLVDELAHYGQVVTVKGDVADLEIVSVTEDSRKVGEGALFVAVEGDSVDGHKFIGSALEQGASAVVCHRWDAEGGSGKAEPVVIMVEDPRESLGILAHAFNGYPSRSLRLIGVTGTNGKTTTTWLIQHMLTGMGRRTGLIGTIENRINGGATAASMTTPAASELNSMLASMVAEGCTEAVMEVSSHAIAQRRIAGLAFSAGVFTNLTRDHLDYHGSWTNYLEAKQRFFTGLNGTATAIMNEDDDSASRMLESSHAMRVSYGMIGHPTYRFDIVENTIDGLKLTIDGDTRDYQLVGEFNAYNLTAAYSVGRSLGFEQTDVLGALESAPPVPGRLERFTFDSGVTVVVDYAHTPDALSNALTAIKNTAPANATLWCIFGCGGDRDPGKRPEMGSIAEAVADRVIVTSDNPRNEAPEAILDDIRDGMERPERAEWIVDRREAIRFAGRSASSGDIVLVAGKGHEPYQVTGTDRIHFDDREEVRRWFG